MPTKKRIQYRYTPTGQRSLLIDPDGGRFTYLYDNVKRLTTVINPQGERTSYVYDAAGRRTVKKLANGSRTSFSYNAASRITSVAHLKSDTSVQASFSYQYDKAGNRTSLSEADGSRTSWSYDAAYQLTAEHRTGANAFRNTFVYDNRGNRTLKNLDGQRTTSTYDAANQLAWSQDASGRTTYTFDADGNQQVVLSPSGDRVTNLWDYENKLIGVQHPAGSRETMAYDPDGKRVKLEESASTTKYVWDDQNYLQETDASDVAQVTYTNEPRTYGNLISQRKAGDSHYYLFDALGSTRLVTDSSQNISESLLYDAWGNLVGSAPTMVVPFRWVGELGYLFVPVTGDYYVRARVYKPSIGRWISQDPLGFVDGLSLFVYSQNRLIIFVDPNGHHLIPPDELLPDIRPVDLLDAELSLLGCRCAGGTITFSVDPYTVRRSRTTGESNLCTRVRFHAEFEPNSAPACRCCEYRQWVKDDSHFRAVHDMGSSYAVVTTTTEYPRKDDEYGRRDRFPKWQSENYFGCGYYGEDCPGRRDVESIRRIMQSMCRIPTEQGLPDSIHVLRDINFESFIIDRCLHGVVEIHA